MSRYLNRLVENCSREPVPIVGVATWCKQEQEHSRRHHQYGQSDLHKSSRFAASTRALLRMWLRRAYYGVFNKRQLLRMPDLPQVIRSRLDRRKRFRRFEDVFGDLVYRLHSFDPPHVFVTQQRLEISFGTLSSAPLQSCEPRASETGGSLHAERD